MMGEAESRLHLAGCPKINLQIRRVNTDIVAFYNALGYVVDDVVSMGRRLEADGDLKKEMSFSRVPGAPASRC
ncbi:MAG TPA: hypothetical protein VM115_07625 [Vicinamibacterales bacterium]|nr:hypothetical protein [Vicinamibacterales bacterium]